MTFISFQETYPPNYITYCISSLLILMFPGQQKQMQTHLNKIVSKSYLLEEHWQPPALQEVHFQPWLQVLVDEEVLQLFAYFVKAILQSVSELQFGICNTSQLIKYNSLHSQYKHYLVQWYNMAHIIRTTSLIILFAESLFEEKRVNTYKYTRTANKIRTTSLCLDPSWLNKKITAASFNISSKSIWNAIWNLLTTTCLWGAGCWGCCCCAACPWFSPAAASELGLLISMTTQLKRSTTINEHIYPLKINTLKLKSQILTQKKWIVFMFLSLRSGVHMNWTRSQALNVTRGKEKYNSMM